MRNLLAVVIAIIAINSAVMAQDLNFTHKIVFYTDKYPNEPNSIFDKLIFGLNNNATDYLDVELGELELFPSHPPSGLHGVFKIPVKDEIGKIWTYTDIRPESENDKFLVTYTINIQRPLLEKITFEWTPLPEKFIDSAVISDNILTTLFRADMMKTGSAVVDNSGLSEFVINIWFNKTKTSVADSDLNNDLLITDYGDYIKISGVEMISEVTIYDFSGKQIDLPYEMGIISGVNKLPTGVYFLKVDRTVGNSQLKHFLRF